MHGASERSLRGVLDRTEEVVASGADASAVGRDLFALALALDDAHSLRRALTEPVVPAEAKRRLLHSLFDSRLGAEALRVAEAGVGVRWSSTHDLSDAMEQASVAAHVARADAEGRLDALEDDLFRFSRIIEANAALREVLSDPFAPVEGKRRLVEDLVGDKVDPTTTVLLTQAVAGRHRSMTAVLSLYQRLAAARRDKMVATVWVAAPLSEEHRERLARALAAQQGRDVHLNVVVDPGVMGGVRVAVGEEVLDSTVATRLKAAQRRIER
jgi:F-type H+-transporting ATPase subunit delta